MTTTMSKEECKYILDKIDELNERIDTLLEQYPIEWETTLYDDNQDIIGTMKHRLHRQKIGKYHVLDYQWKMLEYRDVNISNGWSNGQKIDEFLVYPYLERHFAKVLKDKDCNISEDKDETVVRRKGNPNLPIARGGSHLIKLMDAIERIDHLDPIIADMMRQGD